MAEMQRVNLSHYLAIRRIPKQHLGRDTQVGTQHLQAQSMLVGSGAAVCTHLSRARTRIFYHHAVISVLFYDL